MTHIAILGASSPIGHYTYEFLKNYPNLNITLFMRNPKKAYHPQITIYGDALNIDDLKHALKNVDLVISTLGPYQVDTMAKNLIFAMKENNIKRLIWTGSLGIYGMASGLENSNLGDPNDPSTYLGNQRVAADLLLESGLDVTILRPNWLTNDEIVEPLNITSTKEITPKGHVSRKTVAKFIADLAMHPNQYINESPALSAK